MGRDRQQGSNLATLLRFGASRMVAHLLDEGYTRDQIRGFVQERFSHAPSTVITQILNQGTAAWRAASIAHLLPDEGKIPRRDIPRNRYLPAGTAYRYVVSILFELPGTDFREWRRVSVDASENLTMADLRSAAEAEAHIFYGSRRINIGSPPLSADAVAIDFRVESVEKRTP